MTADPETKKRAVYFLDTSDAPFALSHSSNKLVTAGYAVDENGTAYGVKHISNKPRVSSMPYLYDIAEGNVSGHTAAIVNGYNGSVGATLEEIWDGQAAYTYLTSAERLQIASSHADDDGSPAGDGARTVRVTGLDGDYAEINETVTMNGTTNVLTDASFLRVFSVEVLTVGDTGYNVGDITASNNADDNVLCKCLATNGRSRSSLWTVPAGKTAYLVEGHASTGSAKATEVQFYIREFGQPFHVHATMHLYGASEQRLFPMPFVIGQKADLAVRASAAGGGGAVAAGYSLWYE